MRFLRTSTRAVVTRSTFVCAVGGLVLSLVLVGASPPTAAAGFSDDFEAGLDPSVWHLEVINGARWIHATDADGGHVTALVQNPRDRNNRFADMLTQQEFTDFTLTWDMRFLNQGFHQDRRVIYFRSDGQPVPHGYYIHTAVGYPFGHLVQLLLLLGQRRGEVAKLVWSEIDDAEWRLPGGLVLNF